MRPLWTIRVGARLERLAADEPIAVDFAAEVLQRHCIAEPTCERACDTFGEAVEGARFFSLPLLGHCAEVFLPRF
jgi:hypothetical protein